MSTPDNGIEIIRIIDVPTKVVNTTELRRGDIVRDHGMRVLLNGPESRYEKQGRTVVNFEGTVINMAEVKEAGHVPLSFLRTHKWDATIRRWVTDREDVWHIQGNDLATWSVEDHGAQA